MSISTELSRLHATLKQVCMYEYFIAVHLDIIVPFTFIENYYSAIQALSRMLQVVLAILCLDSLALEILCF